MLYRFPVLHILWIGYTSINHIVQFKNFAIQIYGQLNFLRAADYAKLISIHIKYGVMLYWRCITYIIYITLPMLFHIFNSFFLLLFPVWMNFMCSKKFHCGKIFFHFFCMWCIIHGYIIIHYTCTSYCKLHIFFTLFNPICTNVYREV